MLNFDSNQIDHIENDALKNFKTLEFLSIAHNSLTNLTANNFFNLFSLKSLNLSSNRIRTIDANTFVNLRKLLVLDLSFNEIISLDNHALVGLNRLNDFYLLLKTNLSILLTNQSVVPLTNLTNFYLNESTIVAYKCLLMHSFQRYAQRNIGNKYVFYKSINLISLDASLASNSSLCNLNFEYLQFNFHFDLKSDYQNEMFFATCSKSIIRKANAYESNLKKCFDKSFIETDSERIIASEWSGNLSKMIGNVWFWVGLNLLLLIYLQIILVIWTELECPKYILRLSQAIRLFCIKVFLSRVLIRKNFKYFILIFLFCLAIVLLVCLL